VIRTSICYAYSWTTENNRRKYKNKLIFTILTDIPVAILPSLVTNNVHSVSYIIERKLKFLLLLYRLGDQKKQAEIWQIYIKHEIAKKFRQSFDHETWREETRRETYASIW